MRRIIVALSALALVLVLGAPAFAGGWAVTTLDEVPSAIQAGTTYSIGYTIRQHGATPVNVDEMGCGAACKTEIRITSPDGAKTIGYPGVREGGTGHYVAKVVFPYEGAWRWQVTQGPFAPHELGTIKVTAAVVAPAQAAPGAVGASAPQPSGPNALAIAALLLAGTGAAVLFGMRIADITGRRVSASGGRLV